MLPDLLTLAEDSNPRVRETIGQLLRQFAPESAEAAAALERLATDDTTAAAVQEAIAQQKLLAAAAPMSIDESLVPARHPLQDPRTAAIAGKLADRPRPRGRCGRARAAITEALGRLIDALGGKRADSKESES